MLFINIYDRDTNREGERESIMLYINIYDRDRQRGRERIYNVIYNAICAEVQVLVSVCITQEVFV